MIDNFKPPQHQEQNHQKKKPEKPSIKQDNTDKNNLPPKDQNNKTKTLNRSGYRKYSY